MSHRAFASRLPLSEADAREQGLREALAAFLLVAQQAADPSAATRRAVREALRDPASPLHSARRLRVLAAGKASLAMYRAACNELDHFRAIDASLVIGPPELIEPHTRAQATPEPGASSSAVGPTRSSEPTRAEFLAADHPRSTLRNVAVASQAAAFVDQVEQGDLLLALISGGASAHLALPAPGLTIDDLDEAYAALRDSGATIAELNAVRKHCELLKGGRLAARCHGQTLALILSDVMGDPLDVISSGLTAPDPTTFADARRVLRQRGVEDRALKVVQHVERHINRISNASFNTPRTNTASRLTSTPPTSPDPPEFLDETPKPGDPRFARVDNRVIASNRVIVDALEAHARTTGWNVTTRLDAVEGEAGEVGRSLARQITIAAQAAGSAKPRLCCVLGGEPTVDLHRYHAPHPPRTHSTGVRAQGGPSQEFALATAVALDAIPRTDIQNNETAQPAPEVAWALLAYSTDGVDGSSANAGAIVTSTSLRRARVLGADPAQALANHDSATLFEVLGDQIRTGPTGTNMNHIAVALIISPSE
ncbi:MAG: DUF4147 domain-containing protein [Planctomycetota bacterium]|nr:DUF4147 domain-containing protein [Planctomycetota bacterium]